MTEIPGVLAEVQDQTQIWVIFCSQVPSPLCEQLEEVFPGISLPLVIITLINSTNLKHSFMNIFMQKKKEYQVKTWLIANSLLHIAYIFVKLK